MPQQERLYIGLISGTSIDGIDAALVAFSDDSGEQCRILQTLDHPIPSSLKQTLNELCQPGDNEIECMGQADTLLGREFSAAVHNLLDTAAVSAAEIVAIGSHGQTVRHRAMGGAPFTLQIGDPNIIAEWTGITTVADFRRRDIAAGGQGAPLVPAFHRAVFASDTEDRAVINIGGIANISYLGADNITLGFDTGPGNTLMDAWASIHLHQPFDRDGLWAGTGTPINSLLMELLDEPYFRLPAPKSTGRELFNLEWLQRHLRESLPPSDVQATLLEFTAQSIKRDVVNLPGNVAHAYICGGGALNQTLLRRLQQLLPCPVQSTSTLGIDPEWVEAAAFAWLAKTTMDHQAGNVPSVTGAHHPVILGGIFLSGAHLNNSDKST